MADDTKTTKSETEMEKVEKIEKKEESRSAKFEELRDDLFREAAKLVAEDPSRRIAILVTPPPSESDGSMHSFGYPSAEGVVQTFLQDKLPVPAPEDDDEEENEEDEEEEEEDSFPQGPFWWEDDKLVNTKDPDELMAAIYEMSRLKNRLRTLKNEEELKAAIDESSRRKDNILMRRRSGAVERGQGSGIQDEHRTNDQAGPKP